MSRHMGETMEDNLWVDDPTHTVTANSFCSGYEPDGIITAGIDEPRCSSCFYCVGSGCHNAITSGMEMVAHRISSDRRLCGSCSHNDGGCEVLLGSYETRLSGASERVVEAYATHPSTTGVCPAYNMEILASEEDEIIEDLDSALYMGCWY